MFGDCVLVLEYLTCYQPLFKFELPSKLTVGTFYSGRVELLLLYLLINDSTSLGINKACFALLCLF